MPAPASLLALVTPLPRPAPRPDAGGVAPFVEISGGRAGAVLTAAFRMVLEMQRKGEPVAWIGRGSSSFFPPDAAEAGVDLAALPVIVVADPRAAATVADLLLRSGAFGMIVADLGAEAHLPIPVQTRLAGLAKRHEASLVLLTEKAEDRPSVGSLVSLRVQAARTGHESELYRCEMRTLKDKRRGPGSSRVEAFRGPDGLR